MKLGRLEEGVCSATLIRKLYGIGDFPSDFLGLWLLAQKLPHVVVSNREVLPFPCFCFNGSHRSSKSILVFFAKTCGLEILD